MSAPTRTAVRTAPVLMVDGVSKAFRSGPAWHRRRVEVLRGASLEVRPGKLFARYEAQAGGLQLMRIGDVRQPCGEEPGRPGRMGVRATARGYYDLSEARVGA